MSAWWVNRVDTVSGGDSNVTSPIGAIVTVYDTSASAVRVGSSDADVVSVGVDASVVCSPGSVGSRPSPEHPASSAPSRTAPPYFTHSRRVGASVLVPSLDI